MTALLTSGGSPCHGPAEHSDSRRARLLTRLAAEEQTVDFTPYFTPETWEEATRVQVLSYRGKTMDRIESTRDRDEGLLAAVMVSVLTGLAFGYLLGSAIGYAFYGAIAGMFIIGFCGLATLPVWGGITRALLRLAGARIDKGGYAYFIQRDLTAADVLTNEKLAVVSRYRMGRFVNEDAGTATVQVFRQRGYNSSEQLILSEDFVVDEDDALLDFGAQVQAHVTALNQHASDSFTAVWARDWQEHYPKPRRQLSPRKQRRLERQALAAAAHDRADELHPLHQSVEALGGPAC